MGLCSICDGDMMVSEVRYAEDLDKYVCRLCLGKLALCPKCDKHSLLCSGRYDGDIYFWKERCLLCNFEDGGAE